MGWQFREANVKAPVRLIFNPWTNSLTWTITDVVVFGLTVKMQMLCKVLFSIISYSFSSLPKQLIILNNIKA